MYELFERTALVVNIPLVNFSDKTAVNLSENSDRLLAIASWRAGRSDVYAV